MAKLSDSGFFLLWNINLYFRPFWIEPYTMGFGLVTEPMHWQLRSNGRLSVAGLKHMFNIELEARPLFVVVLRQKRTPLNLVDWNI